MKLLQDVGEALLIPRQSPEPSHPAKVPFDHPTPWQQDEAALGLRQFDHLQRRAI